MGQGFNSDEKLDHGMECSCPLIVTQHNIESNNNNTTNNNNKTLLVEAAIARVTKGIEKVPLSAICQWAQYRDNHFIPMLQMAMIDWPIKPTKEYFLSLVQMVNNRKGDIPNDVDAVVRCAISALKVENEADLPHLTNLRKLKSYDDRLSSGMKMFASIEEFSKFAAGAENDASALNSTDSYSTPQTDQLQIGHCDVEAEISYDDSSTVLYSPDMNSNVEDSFSSCISCDGSHLDVKHESMILATDGVKKLSGNSDIFGSEGLVDELVLNSSKKIQGLDIIDMKKNNTSFDSNFETESSDESRRRSKRRSRTIKSMSLSKEIVTISVHAAKIDRKSVV